MGSEMSTYKIIDYIKTGNIYVAVFSYKSREYQINAPAVINTDNSVHVEHTKNVISRTILDKKAEIDRIAPSNAGSIIGSTFEINENPGTARELAQFVLVDAEEL